jgi:thiol-disulfide isomerase/thioredoxin
VDSLDRADVDGRWSVRFESSEDPAVAVFETVADGTLEGTFLTSTGDYRFLAGDVAGDRLRLSCFDGAHAFRFTARLSDDGALAGDFWSRDTWHETWTAERDESASIPDPYEQTVWRAEWDLGDAVFPDLDGTPRSLADPEFAGRARMLVAFGSWCPNCHDEAPYLAELHRRYGPRGLSILGLAFELTGEFGRDAKQVRRFAERHGVRYPILVAGTADKAKATRAFPMLDFVRSYPTTIFLHADGRVRAVHSGFTGPATGEAWDDVRAEFEGLIEELLAEEPPTHDETWAFLVGKTFASLDGDPAYVFAEADGGRVGGRSASNLGPVTLSGTTVVVAGDVLRVDREAGILFDPRRFHRRFAPAGGSATPSIRSGFLESEGALGVLLESGDAVLRREALVALAELRVRRDHQGNPLAFGLLRDEALSVQLAAVWAVGRNRMAKAIPVLIEHLGDPNAALRREAALALGRIAVMNAEVREALYGLRDDPDPLVRVAAEEALAKVRR